MPIDSDSTTKHLGTQDYAAVVEKQGRVDDFLKTLAAKSSWNTEKDKKHNDNNKIGISVV